MYKRQTYLRAYVPKGAKLVERKMVSFPLTDEAFNKTYFGVFVDTLINGTTVGFMSYELPANITPEAYKLKIQKQSGVGTIPVSYTHLDVYKRQQKDVNSHKQSSVLSNAF